MTDDPTPRSSAGLWYARTLAILIGIIGLVLLGGGVWLIALGGSWYYGLAGAALTLSGILLWRRRRAGAALYALTALATLLWALWEVGLNGWALVPRTVGPLVLLFLVLLALPVLLPDRGAYRLRRLGLAALALLLLAGGVAVGIANRPMQPGAMPQTASAADRAVSGADWVTYGGTRDATRYSALDEITRQNVAGLERVWEYRTGDTPEERWGAETTPLKIGDALYLCSARNILISLDAATGTERWRYDPQVADEYIPYTAACRGVAYHADPEAAPGAMCAARVIQGTLDGRVIAVDAATGTPCPAFGVNGEADITEGMGEVFPGMVSITSPPTIVRDIIVTGHQVLDGQRRDAPSGVIKGFDVRTGELRWAWDMTRPDLTGLPEAGDTYTRGTPNMWTIASGDDALGLVYLPMGNSSVDYWSSDRSAPENDVATALVALDVTTGRPAWRFQTVYMDVWDYDLGSQATLIDFPTDAGAVPAILLPTKQGDMFVLDRRTGEPLTGVEERPVPQGGVEPAQRTATQPFSLYHTLQKPRLTETDMWGMSLIDQMICRIQFRQSVYDGIYTPPTTHTHWIQYPGYNGGSDWGSVAIDPIRGVIFANYNDMPNFNRLVPREEADRMGWAPRDQARGGDMSGGAEGAGDPQWGAPYAIDVNAGWRLSLTGLLCKQPPYGGIRAIELATGRTIWDRPFGTARNNGPWNIPSMVPLDIGTPNNGGAVLTASGLAFIAAATDDLIRAIDIETGETLWQDVLPAGGQANPIVYEVGGRQFLLIMAGGHHFMETRAGDHVIAYALPRP